MAFIAAIGLLCTFIATIYIFLKFFLKKRIPNHLKELPKSCGWPLVGLLLSFKRPMYAYLYHLKETHGPIFQFTLGCRDIIVLNDAKIMTKTMKDLGNIFSGRSKNIVIQNTFHNSGILFTDEQWWATQRNFILKVLRDFGLGKQISQEIVNTECGFLLKEMEEISGKSINIKHIFQKYMLNVISKLVINSRFERHDPKYKIIAGYLEQLAQDDNIFVTICVMYPILEKMSMLSKLLLKCAKLDQQYAAIHQCVRDIISEHEARFDSNTEGEDLIDMFLKEKHKLDDQGVKNHTFTEWQMIRVVTELFVAGFDTTSSTLSWSMFYLSKYPMVQEKLHEEIIEVIGANRAPTLADKKSMNYTQAVMDEIFRCSSVVPLALGHRVLEDTSVDGFYIPKNSLVLPNIYGIHHDKDIWERPFEFYPDHFLIESDGQSKYQPRDELMPFGMGKRQCLGESLARLEYFVFLTSIFQKFKVRFSSDLSDEEWDRINVGTDGIIRAPLDVDIVFELIN